MTDAAKRQLGERIANRLGIEVSAPRPAPPLEPTPAEAEEALADFVGIGPEYLEEIAKQRVAAPQPAPPLKGCWWNGRL